MILSELCRMVQLPGYLGQAAWANSHCRLYSHSVTRQIHIVVFILILLRGMALWTVQDVTATWVSGPSCMRKFTLSSLFSFSYAAYDPLWTVQAGTATWVHGPCSRSKFTLSPPFFCYVAYDMILFALCRMVQLPGYLGHAPWTSPLCCFYHHHCPHSPSHIPGEYFSVLTLWNNLHNYRNLE